MTAEELLAEIEMDINNKFEDGTSRAKAFRELVELLRQEGNIEKAQEVEIQYLVFSFSATDNAKERFKPMIVYSDGSCFPDEASLPKNIKQCLQKLVIETQNPVHIARYGDFLWDKYKDHKSGLKTLNAYIECFSINVEQGDSLSSLDSLRRAIQLGIVFRKNEQLEIIKTKTVGSLDKIFKSSQINYIGQLINELLKINNILDKEDYNLLINSLINCHFVEKRLCQ